MNIKSREAILEVFLSVFFLIYTAAHLYVFLKARAALGFGFPAGMVLAAVMLVMIVSPLLIYYFEKHHHETIAQFFAYTGYIWMGTLFLFVCTAGLTDIYHGIVSLVSLIVRSNLRFLMPSAQLSFFGPLVCSLAIVLYGYFEARTIRTERLAITTGKLPEGTGHLRIVQISDVHIGLIIRKERVERLIRKIQEAQPDILVSTGDLLDGQINGLSGIPEMLQAIRPRYGKFAITGNHEFYAGIQHALEFTKQAGFVILRGQQVSVGGLVNIAGVDDPAGKPFGAFVDADEKELLTRCSRDRFTVLLKHRPVIDTRSTGLFDLQLSGHTHKGQIFPFSLITKLSYIVDAGFLPLGGNAALYVNRGAGTWGPPLRFLSPPEITVIDLTSTPQ